MASYLHLQGFSGSYASAPDSSALSITGDLDIRVKATLANWTPTAPVQNLVAKWTPTGNQRSYVFYVAVDGKLHLQYSTDGINSTSDVQSTVATGLDDGATKWVRVTRRQSDGRTQFFMSDDGSAWNQLGTDVTAATSAIFDSTTVLEVGSQTSGTVQLAIGRFYQVDIRNNILDDGTGIVFNADFSSQAHLSRSFVESSSNAATVTVNGPAQILTEGRPVGITRIGTAAGDGTTITIPAGHQRGDLIIIFAFRGAVTAPSLPTGWTNLGNASSGASSYRMGWKLATAPPDTSGTWTNATGLICHVYRGVATKRAPVVGSPGNTGTGTSVSYSALNPLSNPGSSWVVAFGATKTLGSSLETPPTDLINVANTVGATAEYASHDSNGPYIAGAGRWPTTAVSVGGTSAEWRSTTTEILAEQGFSNNYQSLKVQDGMSAGERIR